MEIKVAALYMPEIYVGDTERNRINLEKVIRECFDKNPGIMLAVGPELANTGFNISKISEGKSLEDTNQLLSQILEIIPEGKTVRLLENLAKEYNTHLVCGIGEKDEAGLRYNSAVFIGPKGFQGTYRQPRVSGFSKWITGYGTENQRTIFQLKNGNIDTGIVICAEITMDEIIGKIAPNVSLIAVPANWYEDKFHTFKKEIKQFGRKFNKPLIVGNRGQEFFNEILCKDEKYGLFDYRGYSAMIYLPGKEPIIKKKTIIKTLII